MGFHAHNNLHAAVANSISAIENGCTSIDGCSRGYGAGAGNLPLEALIALLKLDGNKVGFNLNELIDLSLFIEKNFNLSLPSIDTILTATDTWAISGFKKIIETAQKFNVNPMKIIEKLEKEKCWTRGSNY